MSYLYFLILAVLSIYSYALIDTNLTLFNHPTWELFRNAMVSLGYFHRDISAIIYTVLLSLLWIIHLYLVRQAARVKLKIIVAAGVIFVLFAYPLLSHDVFNYLFDAKIVTHYHSNPYVHTPIEYSGDLWLRFMHWTHRTYPYGPSFLILTVPTLFISMGKFIVAFGVLKLQYAALYAITVLALARRNREWAIFFATSPLVVVEGLMNMHNDMLAVCITILGLLYMKEQPRYARILLIFSGLIKYTTLPFILLAEKSKQLRMIGLAGVVAVMGYLTFIIDTQMQPWYFLTLYAFIPLYYSRLKTYGIFLNGMLYMYIYFIAIGEWSNTLKYQIAAVSLVINIVYNYLNGRRKTSHPLHVGT